MSSTNTHNSNTSSGPTKTKGRFHAAKGDVVEAVGKITGNHSLARSGQREHAEGEAELVAAQVKGYAEGTMDRVVGKKDAIVGAVTGNKTQEISGHLRGDKGQAQQNRNN